MLRPGLRNAGYKRTGCSAALCLRTGIYERPQVVVLTYKSDDYKLPGGDIRKRSAALVRDGDTLVSVVGPVEARPAGGLAVDFVVESDRARLSEIVQRVRDGRLRTNIGNIATLNDSLAAFNSTRRAKGKTIIRVRS